MIRILDEIFVNNPNNNNQVSCRYTSFSWRYYTYRYTWRFYHDIANLSRLAFVYNYYYHRYTVWRHIHTHNRCNLYIVYFHICIKIFFMLTSLKCTVYHDHRRRFMTIAVIISSLSILTMALKGKESMFLFRGAITRYSCAAGDVFTIVMFTK